MSENESGLSLLTVNQTVELLSESYTKLVNNNSKLQYFPSVMLWGPPGIGKSQAVRQIADNIRERTGKRVNITDVRLMLFNPVDLRGIPTANEDKTLAVWLRPQIFQMDESPDAVNILLLDEISAAPQSVQAAAYQITLDRSIGEHKLPENCIVIAAGNRITDKSVAYNMPRALANRLLHIEIKCDANSWHDWAVVKGIHRYVTSYLEYNPTALLHSDDLGNLAFPTPRSWEMVSNILTNINEDVTSIKPLITGCIGSSAAYSFIKWCDLFSNLPKVTDILTGAKVSLANHEELYLALKSEIVSYIGVHPKRKYIDNCINFALKQSWKFRTGLLHDLALIPHIKVLLSENEIYVDAIKAGLK